MAVFRMKIAGAVAEIQSMFDSTPQYFRAYLTEETPEFFVSVQPEHLRFEQAELDREAVEEGFRFRTFTDPFLERAAIQRAFAEVLFERNTLLLHGSAVALDSRGYLFTARSGTGKSTHTRLWREVFGDRAVMINDDKPFVALTAQGVTIFGSPWSGKHGLDTNIAVPLQGICFLQRGKDNVISPADRAEMLERLRKQAYCPDGKQKEFLEIMQKLAEKVSIWDMECTKSRSAALVAHEAMCGGNEVKLRPFRPEDEQNVLPILMDGQVNQTYMLPDFESEEAARPLFQRLMQLSCDPERFVRAICLEERVIGFLNDVEITPSRMELGYVVSPRYQGRGYATQALKAAIDAVFERGLETVRCGAFEQNVASLRVMEKSGMHRIEETEEISYRGRTHHCIYYEINKMNILEDNL